MQTIGTMSGEKTLGMIEDLAHKLRKGVLTPEQLDRFLNKKDPFESPKRLPKGGTKRLVESWLDRWNAFYDKFFGLRPVVSKLVVPDRQAGFDRLIVVRGTELSANSKGNKPQNFVYDALGKYFPCSRYANDLDASVTKNDRSPECTYALWVRDRVEADEELKNFSANELSEKKIAGETLMERMLHELFYWDETGGGHLDLLNWTLCSASRDSGGGVPRAGWDGRRFHVHWCSPGSASAYLRARAVSVNP